MDKFGKVNGVANYLDYHAWKCNGIYIYNSDCLNLDIGPTTLHRKLSYLRLWERLLHLNLLVKSTIPPNMVNWSGKEMFVADRNIGKVFISFFGR